MSFYLAQSERMQQLLRMVNLGGLISFLSPGLGALAYYFFFARFTAYDYYHPIAAKVSISLVFFVAWLLLALILSIGLIRTNPYGMQLNQVFILIVSGPFRSDVADFDPNEKHGLLGS
jgi:ABC-type branched-subunit amino acid transport system permease subunit